MQRGYVPRSVQLVNNKPWPKFKDCGLKKAFESKFFSQSALLVLS